MAVSKNSKVQFEHHQADPNRLPKMKAKYKKKWLKALRSDKYKQLKSRLTDGEAFCCIGVLCDITQKETESSMPYGLWMDYTLPPYDLWQLVLTKKMLKDMQKYNLKFDHDQDEELAPVSIIPLVVRNDGVGLFNNKQQSFKEIADVVEKYM